MKKKKPASLATVLAVVLFSLKIALELLEIIFLLIDRLG